MKIFALVLCFLVLGCATSQTSLRNKISKLTCGPYGYSVERSKEIMGVPPSQEENITNDIVRLTYNYMPFGGTTKGTYWLYFKNDKLVKKSNWDYFSTELEDYYALGLISTEEYQERSYNNRQNAIVAFQAFSAMQSMNTQRQMLQNQEQYQEKSLENQEEYLKRQRQNNNPIAYDVYNKNYQKVGELRQQ